MSSAWTTADYALIVSLVSLFITIANFIWGIWAKFIFPKPRVEVKLQYVTVPAGSGQVWPTALCLSAVNHGPGDIHLVSTIGTLKRSGLWKRPFHAVFRGYNSWPHDTHNATIGGPSMPKRLQIGENCLVFLVSDGDKFSKIKRFGFSDTFGRVHWATSKNVQFALASLAADNR